MWWLLRWHLLVETSNKSLTWCVPLYWNALPQSNWISFTGLIRLIGFTCQNGPRSPDVPILLYLSSFAIKDYIYLSSPAIKDLSNPGQKCWDGKAAVEDDGEEHQHQPGWVGQVVVLASTVFKYFQITFELYPMKTIGQQKHLAVRMRGSYIFLKV